LEQRKEELGEGLMPVLTKRLVDDAASIPPRSIHIHESADERPGKPVAVRLRDGWLC
jgi:hypothetical protein